MGNNGNQQNGLPDFSLAFQQMCGIFAIAKSKNPQETLQRLILQTLSLLPGERFFHSLDLGDAIYAIFNIKKPVHEIDVAIQELILKKKISFEPGAYIQILPNISAEILQEIKLAEELESRVKRDWLSEVKIDYPLIPQNPIWTSLKEYLTKSFRRHGIQAVAMLNPSLQLSGEITKNLSTILQEISQAYSPEIRPQAQAVISKFMAEAHNSADRTKYITQIADGAFSFFSLATSPEAAETFRAELSPLTIFLDTNFLFGILDFSTGPHVEVSNELMAAVEKFQFPFKFKYHEVTRKEISATIDGYKDSISSMRLSTALARAASKSPYISGVEHRYYERHLGEGISVEDFFRPFLHFDELLKQKNIDYYAPEDTRKKHIAELFSDYSNFIKGRYKEKPYESVIHDVTVLDEVRKLRSKSGSSLKAEALMLTCDYQLYLFDNEDCRRKHLLPSTVLPNLFWQILRPFIPSEIDFDRAFAGTFAIPEFRIIGSGSTNACTKALMILNSYKDFPESTAIRLLSNDILIEQLQATKNDNDFKKLLDLAIVEENNSLLEEKAELQSQVEREHEIALKAKELVEQSKNENIKKSEEAAQYRSSYEQLQVAVQKEHDALVRKIAEEKTANESSARKEKEKSEEKISIYQVFIAVILAILVVGTFELLTNLLPWSWMVNHSRSLVLQGAIDVSIISLITYIVAPRTRKWSIWPTIVSAVIDVLLAII